MQLARRLINEAIADLTYLIRVVNRRPGEKAAYEVSKFSGRKQPDAVYRITYTERGWRCDCPGFARVGSRQVESHKHIKLVKAWIKLGKPSPITKPGFQSWAQSAMS